jgi:TPR repeat protein
LSKGYVSYNPRLFMAYFCSAPQAINSGNAYQRTGDFEKSIFWYERALFLDPDGSNNSQATFALSDLYMANGDVKKSLDYLKQSAGLGYMQAEERLGDAYMYGNGVSKNKTEAKKWLKKAHDHGSKAAEGICGCEF